MTNNHHTEEEPLLNVDNGSVVVDTSDSFLSRSGGASITDLDDYTLGSIFQFIQLKELLQSAVLVSRQWNRACFDSLVTFEVAILPNTQSTTSNNNNTIDKHGEELGIEADPAYSLTSQICAFIQKFSHLRSIKITSDSNTKMAPLTDAMVIPILKKFEQSLESADFGFTSLRDPHFDVPNLKQLSLRNCKNLNSISIDRNSLVYLNLSRTTIRDDDLITPKLKGLTKLETLDLTYCKNLRLFKLPSNICATLTYLNLTDCSNLVDTCLNELLPRMPNLRTLHANSCKSMKSLVLVGVPSLETLSLTYNRIRNLQIVDCPSLRNVDITANALRTNVIINILKNNPRITHFNFSRCYAAKDDETLLKQLPSQLDLEVVDFSFCPCGDAFMRYLTQRSPKLREIRAAKSEFSATLTEDETSYGALASPSLAYLDIAGCSVSEYGITRFCSEIPSLFPQLKHLTLGDINTLPATIRIESSTLECVDVGATPITGETLKNILAHCPSLKSLIARYCGGVRHHLSLHHERLESLDLDQCRALEELDVSQCPRLRVLSLTGCLSLARWNLSNCHDLCWINIANVGLFYKQDLVYAQLLAQLREQMPPEMLQKIQVKVANNVVVDSNTTNRQDASSSSSSNNNNSSQASASVSMSLNMFRKLKPPTTA